jgi:hypothetical protein
MLAALAFTLLPLGLARTSAAETASSGARPLHVLFIGNSYTSVNSLPSIFEQITASAGLPKPVVASVTPGGWQLMKHLQNPGTLAKIDDGAGDGARWDVVVLQEQSQTPAMAETSDNLRKTFLDGVTGLYDRIKAKNPNARVVLYETWARHADLWKTSSKDTQSLGRSPADMQARLRKWYGNAAKEIAQRSKAIRKTDVLIARVGDFWELHYQSANPIRLHRADGSHPEFIGSYLAGLVMFATIFDTSPQKVTWHGNLPEADATAMKNLVAKHPELLPQHTGR